LPRAVARRPARRASWDVQAAARPALGTCWPPRGRNFMGRSLWQMAHLFAARSVTGRPYCRDSVRSRPESMARPAITVCGC